MVNTDSQLIQEVMARNPILTLESSILNVSRDLEKTTEKYRETNDAAVVKLLNDRGWSMVRYEQRKARDAEKRIYKPFLATFENPAFPALEGEGRFQMLMIGAKDGTKAQIFDAGFWRGVCLNGLIVGTSLFKRIRTKHIGAVPEHFDALIESAVEQVPAIYDRINDMKAVTLTESQKFEFAAKAISLRLGSDNKHAMKPEEVLITRRVADEGNSLWVLMNRLQENLVKAPVGVSITNSDGKTRKARALTNIEKRLSFNRELWEVCESYMQ